MFWPCHFYLSLHFIACLMQCFSHFIATHLYISLLAYFNVLAISFLSKPLFHCLPSAIFSPFHCYPGLYFIACLLWCFTHFIATQGYISLLACWRSLLSSTDSCQNPGNSQNSGGIKFGRGACQIDQMILAEFRTEFKFHWNGSRNYPEGMLTGIRWNRILAEPLFVDNVQIEHHQQTAHSLSTTTIIHNAYTPCSSLSPLASTNNNV